MNPPLLAVAHPAARWQNNTLPASHEEEEEASTSGFLNSLLATNITTSAATEEL